MNKKAAILYLLCALVIIVACSDPRIDASTDETLKQSIEKVRNSLPEDKREEFDLAINELAFGDLSFDDYLLRGANSSFGIFEAQFKDQINGKTGEEIITEARERLSQRARIREEQALQEIADLEAKAALAESNRDKLKAFTVLKSIFYLRHYSFGMSTPIVELTVSNGTPFPISRAYFIGTVASPGRAIPWVKDEFSHAIPGGLEPGEEATWKLYQNSYSAWGNDDIPKDAILTVEVVKLDGPNGEEVLNAEGLSERETERLADLKRIYSVK